MSHANAALTPRARLTVARLVVEQGVPVSEVAARFQCSWTGTEDANDVLAETDGTVTWFDGARINNPNTHGTGCTLSSAIASYLALGDTLPKAIKHAKKYLTGALKAQLNLGHGSGPMDHFWKYR